MRLRRLGLTTVGGAISNESYGSRFVSFERKFATPKRSFVKKSLIALMVTPLFACMSECVSIALHPQNSFAVF